MSGGVVLQVAFNPSLWAHGTSGTEAGASGYNAGSVYNDLDGTTAWAFEFQGSGFARFNLSTGSIVHQDATFGVPNGSTPFYYRGNCSVFWVQDGNGNYFTIDSNLNLYRFTIGTGTAGTLLNGYEVISYTADLTSYMSDVQDMIFFTHGGVNYLALMGKTSSIMVVFYADTLTFVGQWSGISNIGSSSTGWKVFADSNGYLWGLFANASVTSTSSANNTLVSWNPDYGVIGTTLNLTSNTLLTSANHGLSYPATFCTYISSANAIFLGCNNYGTNTGDSSIYYLSGWYHFYYGDDLRLFFSGNGAQSSNEGNFDLTQGSSLMIQGAMNTPYQVGGALYIINPSYYSNSGVVTSSYNIPQIINESTSTLTPVKLTLINNAQVAYISSIVVSGSSLTFSTIEPLYATQIFNNLAVGSQMYFNHISGATWLNANSSPMTVTSPTDTSFSGTDPYGSHSSNTYSQTKPYAIGYCAATALPSLSSYAWNQTTNQVAVTFQPQGSPVYIVPLSASLYEPTLTPSSTSLLIEGGDTTTTITSVSPNPIVPNQTVSMTAHTVEVVGGGNPDAGYIQFLDGSTALSGQIAVSSGSASFSTSSITTPGSHSLFALFTDPSGDNYSSESAPYTLLVNQTPTSVVIETSSSPSQYSNEVTFLIYATSPVTGHTVTLTDTLNNSTSTLATLTLDGNNTASYTTSSLVVGDHLVTATYNGGVDYQSSQGYVIQEVVAQNVLAHVLPPFAIMATYNPLGDEALPPTAYAVAIPSTTTAATPIFIIWNSSSIVQVEITGNNGIDPVVNSGFISTQGSGTYEIASGFTNSITLLFNAYDTVSHIAVSQDIQITIT